MIPACSKVLMEVPDLGVPCPIAEPVPKVGMESPVLHMVQGTIFPPRHSSGTASGWLALCPQRTATPSLKNLDQEMKCEIFNEKLKYLTKEISTAKLSLGIPEQPQIWVTPILALLSCL